jgi:hypothetical protein
MVAGGAAEGTAGKVRRVSVSFQDRGPENLLLTFWKLRFSLLGWPFLAGYYTDVRCDFFRCGIFK